MVKIFPLSALCLYTSLEPFRIYKSNSVRSHSTVGVYNIFIQRVHDDLIIFYENWFSLNWILQSSIIPIYIYISL